MRALLLAAGLAWSLGAGAAQALLSIVIDDVGNSLERARAVLELPPTVSVSVLPRLPASRWTAETAHAQGREVLLHQPMASVRHKALGPGGITLDHTRADLEAVLAANLRSVPHVSGINNHMGSLLTGEPRSMRWLMEALERRGGLFFLDSRTNPQSVAARQARARGLPAARRDVFLDNDRDPEAIRRRLDEAIRIARLKGSAIAIGHPYPETLAVLRERLPALSRLGVELRPVSHVIAYQRSPETWHASSYPLPQVAKNSKR